MYSNKKNQDNNENFWISYADLMAGLLFVFILVIGAIIIKFIYAQENLKVIKSDLKKEQQALNINEKELSEKRKKLLEINTKLEKVNKENVHLTFELAKSKNMFDDTNKELVKAKELTKKLNDSLDKNKKDLQLSTEQIEKITAILEDKTNKIELLNKDFQNQKTELTSKLDTIKLNMEEITKLKDLLLGYELKDKKQNEENTNLSKEIEKNVNMIQLKDGELALLEKKLLEQSKVHQSLVEEFDITKVKIKRLTGIKIDMISKIREKLGDSIDIDRKSGAIKFSSNILFGQGEYEIKESSKPQLKIILEKYIHTLLKNDDIRKHIHSITIEGHTNSDGSYIDNLELSQKRALEVMKFLYKTNIINQMLIRKYVNASGRSYSDRIYKKGVEDKDNSRRIELKFRIKNEVAIKELSNFLGEKK